MTEPEQTQAGLQQQVEQQRLVMEMTHRIRRSLNLQDILQVTVDEVRQYLQIDRVIIFQFSPGWGGTVVVESVAEEWMAILPFQIHDSCIGEEYVEPFKQGLVTAKADIYNAGISPCHVEFLARFQVRANLVVPILKGDELWGLLVAHHCTAPHPWQTFEIDLLRQLATQAGVAIQQADLFAQLQTELAQRKQADQALQQLNAELEQRVAERTAELTQVNDRLLAILLEQQQTQRLLQEQAQLLELAHNTIMTLDLNWGITYWNQGAELMYGWSKAEAVGQVSHVLLKNQFPQPLAIIEAELLQKGYWEGELMQRSRDDRPITVLSRWVLQKDDAGKPIKILEINSDITERKQIECELRQSEERRRLALDLTHIGFWDLHLPSGTVIWNETHFTLLGLAPNEVAPSYQLWRSHVHPDDITWVEQVYRESIATHTDYAAEYRVVHPDGSVHWLMARAKATYDAAGQPLRSLGVLLDISKRKHDEAIRKHTEAALQQQTRQMQLLWNITQAIRQSLDLTAILSAAVTEVRQLLQVDRVAVYRFHPNWSGDFIAESVSSEWVKLVEPGICKVWEDTYLQETQGGRFRHHETFVVADIYTVGLQPCHIELLEQFQARAYAIAPVFVGDSLWGLFAIYQNATSRHWQSWEIDLLQQIASQLAIAIQQSELYEQLQIELQERKQSAATLREAERRWRYLLDNVQLIVVGLDRTGTVNYVNPFFLSLTGYTRPEVMGKNWFENFLPYSNQQSVQSVFSEVLTDNAHPYYRNAILTKSHEERMIAWNNTVLKDLDGNVIGTISIGEDVTQRQAVEKLKDEFISIVSHELRTPLTSIRGSLGLLATGVMDDEPDEMKQMIEIAAIETERLVRLVNDILDLEKLESGRVSLVREWCDAADLMQRSVAVMERSIQEGGVQLVVHPLSVQIWVAADRIIQTFTNLLSNAIKFSSPGGTVTLSAKLCHPSAAPSSKTQSSLYSTSSSQILFSIQDQGRGIPADKLESIFGRFQQVDASDSRDKGGTGLGLAICKSIVQQHGGHIWVESHWGQGSTFFFTLPLQLKERRDT